MKRYHESKYPASSSSSHQRSTSGRLCVPIFETPARKVLSEENRSQDSSSRDYNVQEVRPGPKPAYDYDLISEPVLPSQLPARLDRRPQHQKRPSIKVEIHQDNPPSSTTSTGATPRRSPGASPRSPTAQPQLQYQYSTLQNKLDQLSSICAPYLKVEAANPRDLTFAKIAEQANSFAFDLQVWAYTSNLDGLVKIDQEKRNIVEAASRNLDRLIDRVTELVEVCMKAKPKDLKFVEIPEVDEETMFDDEGDDQ